jgi:hypothetical protein
MQERASVSVATPQHLGRGWGWGTSSSAQAWENGEGGSVGVQHSSGCVGMLQHLGEDWHVGQGDGGGAMR